MIPIKNAQHVIIHQKNNIFYQIMLVMLLLQKIVKYKMYLINAKHAFKDII